MKLGLEILKTNVGINISILDLLYEQIFRQNGQLWIFRPKFAQNVCKNLSLDLESASSRYHVYQYSVKTGKFEFFYLNLGKLPNYMQYLAANDIEGVARSWVEVDGAGWRWMRSLATPINLEIQWLAFFALLNYRLGFAPFLCRKSNCYVFFAGYSLVTRVVSRE